MSWTTNKRSRYTVDEAMELISRHRLLAHHAVEAAGQCAVIAQSDVWEITDGGDIVATVFARQANDPFIATLDAVPVTKYFRAKEEFQPQMIEALKPVVEALRSRGVGRIATQIPASRGKTMKMLKAAGFRYEGRMRDAVLLGRANEREDLYIYALMVEEREAEE